MKTAQPSKIENMQIVRANQAFALQEAVENDHVTIHRMREVLGEECRLYLLTCLHARGLLEPCGIAQKRGGSYKYRITPLGRISLHASMFGVKPSYMPMLRKVLNGQDRLRSFSKTEREALMNLTHKGLILKVPSHSASDGSLVKVKLSSALKVAFRIHEPDGAPA